MFRDVKYDWQFLRDFFAVAYFKLLVTWFAIVPILVVTFGDLPDVVRIPSGAGEVLTIHVALPFKWWVLWWSSFFYVIAASLYLLLGPRFIRQYVNYAAYKTHQHSPRWIIWEWRNFLKSIGVASDVDVIVSKGLATPVDKSPPQPAIRETSDLCVWQPAKDPDETWFVFKRDGKFYRLGLGGAQEGHALKEEELFWELYGQQASSKPFIRGLIWVTLAVSALLFLIAVGQNIYAVLRYLYDAWHWSA